MMPFDPRYYHAVERDNQDEMRTLIQARVRRAAPAALAELRQQRERSCHGEEEKTSSDS
jgi:hypothetical protein